MRRARMPAHRPKKIRKRATPQIKLTIPRLYAEDVKAAMHYDGATKISTFALAALMQRVRRLLEQKALEQKSKDS